MSRFSCPIKSEDFHLIYEAFRKKFILYAYPDGVLPMKRNKKGKLVQVKETDEDIWLKEKTSHDYVVYEIIGRFTGGPTYLLKKSTSIPKENGSGTLHASVFNRVLKFLGYKFSDDDDMDSPVLAAKAKIWVIKEIKKASTGSFEIPENHNFTNLFESWEIKYQLEKYWHLIEGRNFEEVFRSVYPDRLILGELNKPSDFADLYSAPSSRNKICAFNISRTGILEAECNLYYENEMGFEDLNSNPFINSDQYEQYVSLAISELKKCASSFRIEEFEPTIDDFIEVPSIKEFWIKQGDFAKNDRDRSAFMELAEAVDNNVTAYVVYFCTYIFIDKNVLLNKVSPLSMSFRSQRQPHFMVM